VNQISEVTEIAAQERFLQSLETLKHRAIKSVFWVALTKFAGQGMTWAVTIWLMRILSPKDYGLMGMAMSYQAIAVILFDLGLGEAIIQKKDLSDEEIDSSFWFSICFGAFLYLITWFIAELCAGFYSNQDLTMILRVLGLGIMILSVKEIPYMLMARHFEFKKRSAGELMSGTGSLLVSLVLALQGYGVWSLVLGQVVGNLLLTVQTFWVCGWRPRLRFNFGALQRLLKFGVPVTGHYLLSYVCNRSDSVIIGRFLGDRSLGFYSVAMDLARTPIDKMITIVNKVSFPVFAEIQNNPKELGRYLLKLVSLTSLVCFPILVGMLMISKEIIMLILSEKWMASLDVFRIFCILVIFQTHAGLFVIVLKALGKTSDVLKYSLWSALLLPMAFLAGTRFDLIGVGLSWLIVYPVLFAYLLYKVFSELDLRITEYGKSLRTAFTGSLFMAVFVMIGKRYLLGGSISIATMTICIIIGICTYVGYICLFSREVFGDLKQIVRMVRG